MGVVKTQSQEPKGIGFFNIKSGVTDYAKMEAQIQAYINSSDMGINASRGQDFGWRLSAEWVKKVKEFSRDETKMAILTNKADGRKVTMVQILYYIYGQELRNYSDALAEDENPFEEQYLQDISNKKGMAKVTENPETTNEVKTKP